MSKMNEKLTFFLRITLFIGLFIFIALSSFSDDRQTNESHDTTSSPPQATFPHPELFAFPFFEKVEGLEKEDDDKWIDAFTKKQKALEPAIKLGIRYKLQKENDKAREHFLSLSHHGSVTAMFFLSQLSAEERNNTTAFYWAFLALETHWIATGEIHPRIYAHYNELNKNIDEIINLASLINKKDFFKPDDKFPTEIPTDLISSRLWYLYSVLIENSAQAYQHSFIANYQLYGIAKKMPYSNLSCRSFLGFHGTIALKHPCIHNILPEQDRFNLIYDCFVKANRFDYIATMILNGWINRDENGNIISDKNRALGNLYAKDIKNNTENPDSFFNLGILIYNHEYFFNENGTKITQKKYMPTVIRLMQTATKKGSGLGAQTLFDLIHHKKCHVDENNIPIKSEEQRNNVIAHLCRIAYKAGLIVPLGHLAEMILNDAATHDEENNMIPPTSKQETAARLFRTVYQAETDISTRMQALCSIGVLIGNKEINHDERGQLIPENQHSQVASYIFRKTIAHGHFQTHNLFGNMIRLCKINHDENGIELSTKTERINAVARIYRAGAAHDLYALQNFIALVLSKKINEDEQGKPIPSDQIIKWGISMLEKKEMLSLPKAKGQLAFCLLFENKHCDIATRKKALGLLEEVVTEGSTCFYNHMIWLKEMIAQEELTITKEASSSNDTEENISIENDSNSAEFEYCKSESNETTSQCACTSSSLSTVPIQSPIVAADHILNEDMITKHMRKKRLKEARIKTENGLRGNHKKEFLKSLETGDFSKLFKRTIQKYKVVWLGESLNDRNSLKPIYQRKITEIIHHIQNSINPYEGAKKLCGDLISWYSHRINEEKRFVFRISGNEMIIKSCMKHYS